MRTVMLALGLAVMWLNVFAGIGGLASGKAGMAMAAGEGDTNAFNPYMRKELPNVQDIPIEGKEMMQQIGSVAQSIKGEAAHRPHWREEVYPVLFGNPTAPHEIIVLLDFAKPASQSVWGAIVQATHSLAPGNVKVAVFGNSGEKYGTDLMGFAIWLSYSRKDSGMPYMTWALERWNKIKADQKRLRGAAIPFETEYDAAASPTEYPMIYDFLSRMKPPVRGEDELALSRYCYDAGNVNLYQGVQVAAMYGVKALPAVVVDGRVLRTVTPSSVISAVR